MCVVVLAVDTHSKLSVLDLVCAPHVLPMCVSHVCITCVYHMCAPMCSPCVLRVRYPLQTKIRIVIVIGTIATIAWHPGRVGEYQAIICCVCSGFSCGSSQ